MALKSAPSAILKRQTEKMKRRALARQSLPTRLCAIRAHANVELPVVSWTLQLGIAPRPSLAPCFWPQRCCRLTPLLVKQAPLASTNKKRKVAAQQGLTLQDYIMFSICCRSFLIRFFEHNLGIIAANRKNCSNKIWVLKNRIIPKKSGIIISSLKPGVQCLTTLSLV